MTIPSRIHDILVDVLMLDDPGRVTPEAHIVRDLGAESINLAELVVAIENEFHIAVPPDAIAQASTVAALVATVEAAILAQQASG